MTSAKTKAPAPPASMREAHRPELLLIDGVPLVLPAPYDRLHPATQEAVAALERLAGLGDQKATVRAVLAFEERHGITAEDRVAVMRPANDTDRALEAAIILAMGSVDGQIEVKVPAADPPPPKTPTLPRDLEIRIDRASKRAAKAKTREERDRAIDAREAVVAEAARRTDMAWLDDVKAELAKLEGLRGGKVTVREEVVRVPVLKDGAPMLRRGLKVMRDERVIKIELSNRDGLEALLAAGSISPMQYAAGMKYRTVYEDADPERGLAPPNPDRGGSPAGDPFGDKAIRVARTRAKKGADLLKLDAVVFRARREPSRLLLKAEGVAVFRKVVGEGRTLRELAFSGSVRTRYSAMISAGLDALADGWGLQ